MIEEKIGEVLGLEMAAQKAVDQLVSKGLLEKGSIKQQVEEIQKEAHNHQTQIEELCERLCPQSVDAVVRIAPIASLKADSRQLSALI